MGRVKGSKNKKTNKKDPSVEEIVEVEIEYVCPKRGKVKEKVKVKRLKSFKVDSSQMINTRDMVEDVDNTDEINDQEDVEE